MGEVPDDFKKKIFSDKKFNLKYFSIYNSNGNLTILSEIFKQNNALYCENLFAHLEEKVLPY